VSTRSWNPVVRAGYFASRRRMGTVLPSVRLYARRPSLLGAFGVMDAVVSGQREPLRRLTALATLRAAMLVDCPYCLDLKIWEARFRQLTRDEIAAVAGWRGNGVFAELESACLGLAEQMTATPVEASDDIFRTLRKYLKDNEILMLSMAIGWENCRARVSKAMRCPSAHLADAQ
jgi:alkylhydroperoxidase family enzyme